MSMCYWGITGYGVCLDEIYNYINKEKVNKLVKVANPKEEFEDDVFDDDTFCGSLYNSFAEFLLEFDDRRIMSYDDNGNGIEYFLYIPPYPWQATEHEPKTRDELTDYIIRILQRVYDASYNDLFQKIDYINTYGCG